MYKLNPEEKAHLLKRQAMAKKNKQKPEESPEKNINENTIMSPATQRVVEEREKQFHKGFSLAYDFNRNPAGTLSQAAKALLEFDIHKRIDQKPKLWDTYAWQKQCIKPERERLAIAATWCIAELDRYYFNETNKDEKKG